MVWPVSLNTESRKRTLVSGVGYTAWGGVDGGGDKSQQYQNLVVVFNSAAVLPVSDSGTNAIGHPPPLAQEVSHRCIRSQAAGGA